MVLYSSTLSSSLHLLKLLWFSPLLITSVFWHTMVLPPLVPLSINLRETKSSSSFKTYTPYILTINSSVHPPIPLYFVSVMGTCTIAIFSSIQLQAGLLASSTGNVPVSVLGGQTWQVSDG